MDNSRTFVLIPAFNEALTIRELVRQALAIVADVIVVDHGSPDATRAELAGLPITVLVHERNLGKAASLWRGIDHAMAHGATRVVTLDGDGQHNPEDIRRMLRMANEYPKRIVIGARLHDRDNFPPARYYANRFACAGISWMAGQAIADTQSGFRVYPAHLLAQLSHEDVSWGRFVFESEILIEAGERNVRCICVGIPGIYPQAARRSHFRPVVDVTRIAAMASGRLLRRTLQRVAAWCGLKRSPQRSGLGPNRLSGPSYTPRKP